jgi:hypothetical protein
LTVIFSACGSSEKQASENSDYTDKSDTVKTNPDTMTIQHPEPSLSPGTAKIRATIEKIMEDDKDVNLYIVVNQVLKYGSSTPSLPTGQSLKVKASTYKKNARQKFSTLNEGKQFILFVGYTESFSNMSQNWTLHKIETDTTNN